MTSSPAHSLVAVVIPCYRQAHYLPEAIESVLTQRRPAAEILVVDDGSPDRTAEVAGRYPQVDYVRQENRGVAAARNRGAEMCRSDLIVFLDADDRLLPHALAAASAALEARPEAAFAWGFNRPIDASGQILGGISNPYSGTPTYAQLLQRNIVGPPAGVMFRRRPVLDAGGFFTELDSVEDYDLYLRLAQTAPFVCLGELIVEYRQHDANMSSNHARMLRATHRVLDRQADWVRQNPALKRALARGRRDADVRYDGARRVERLGEHLHQGRWLEALVGAAALSVRYPGMFLPLAARRAWRRIKRKPAGGG